MTPFRIHCETCQTALRVRDPGFIGEVHACPKCGSMVQIVAPAASQATDTPPAAEATQQHTTQAQSTTLVLGSTLETDPTELRAPSEPPSQPPPQAEHEPPQPAPTVTGAPPSLVYAVGSLACLAIGGATAWLIVRPAAPVPAASRPAEEPVAVVAARDALSTDPNAARIELPEEAASVGPDGGERLTEPAVEHPHAERSPGEPSPVEVIAADPAEATRLLPTQPEPPVIDDETPLETAPLPGVAAPRVEDVAFAPPPDFDPLDYDAATIELVLRHDGGEPSAGPPPESIPSIDPTPIAPDPTQLLDERLSEAARDNGVFVARGPSAEGSNSPPTTPAETLLAVLVPQIELDGVPLADAVDLFSGLSGTPISVAPNDLAMAGLGPRTPVAFRGEDSPLGDVLAEGLSPYRLGLQAEGAFCRVRRIGADRPKRMTHRLADLAGDDPEPLLQLLREVGPATLADATIDPSGRLELDALNADHYQLLVLAERLRVARRLAPQTRYPARLLSRSPAIKGLDPVLSRRTTFSFVEPTPFREVINHMRRVTRLTILIDWPSLAADAGIGPRSTLVASATNRRWYDALEGVLTPLGLNWTPVDGKTIWIASRSALRRSPSLDVYQVRSRRSAERATTRASGIAYDQPSGCLFAAGGQALHRDLWQSLAEAAAPGS